MIKWIVWSLLLLRQISKITFLCKSKAIRKQLDLQPITNSYCMVLFKVLFCKSICSYMYVHGHKPEEPSIKIQGCSTKDKTQLLTKRNYMPYVLILIGAFCGQLVFAFLSLYSWLTSSCFLRRMAILPCIRCLG